MKYNPLECRIAVSQGENLLASGKLRPSKVGRREDWLGPDHPVSRSRPEGAKKRDLTNAIKLFGPPVPKNAAGTIGRPRWTGSPLTLSLEADLNLEKETPAGLDGSEDSAE